MEWLNGTKQEKTVSRLHVLFWKRSYKITHTNWHWHHYELDIVAVKDTWLVVVEVKTRSDDYLLAPEDAVDAPKSAVSWRQPMRMSAFSILNYRSVLTS